jgi:hypothetical protein
MAEDDGAHLSLKLEPGHTGTRTFNARLTPAFRDEFYKLLDEAGIHHSDILDLSNAGTDLWVCAVSAGSLSGLAAVLNAFFQRHRHKHFEVETKDGVVRTSGFSQKQTLEMLDRLADRQEEFDGQWRKALRRDDQPVDDEESPPANG